MVIIRWRWRQWDKTTLCLSPKEWSLQLKKGRHNLWYGLKYYWKLEMLPLQILCNSNLAFHEKLYQRLVLDDIYVKLKRSYYVGKQAIAWVSFQATVFLWSWLGSHCKANRLETSLSSWKFSVCFHLPPVTKYPGSVRERNCAEIEWEINFLNAPGRTFIEWLRSRLERKVILCPNSWKFFDSFAGGEGEGGVFVNMV